MKVVHVIPQTSIFEGVVKQHAYALGQVCFTYTIKRRFGMDRHHFLALYRLVKQQPQALFIFHRVPHAVALALSLLSKDFRYVLWYWGEDYYSNFLSESEFERHCIAKSPLLQPEFFLRPVLRPRAAWRRHLQNFIALMATQRAAGIGLCNKQFRFLRSLYFKQFGVALQTPQLWLRGYSPDHGAPQLPLPYPDSSQSLTVLICHSATVSVAHRQTLEILRAYKSAWNVQIHVRGFLSYSGGDESFRDQLERELTTRADFADSVQFERSFLSLEALGQKLQEADLAVFSCLRDEGVSLLTQFVKMGGVVSFNRFSINYDFFKVFSPSKLLSHEELLRASPSTLRQKRMQMPDPAPRMLGFDELHELTLQAGKLLVPDSTLG